MMPWPRLWLDFVNRSSRSASSTFLSSESPSVEEKVEAVSALEKALRPAAIGELGGFRPADKDNRGTSWWGGNFLAVAGEPVPHCFVSGRPMQPVFQAAIGELPVVPDALKGKAIVQLWLDLHSEIDWDKATNCSGFCIRVHDNIDDMVALGPGYRENPTFPTFPISWSLREGEAPSWDDFATSIPCRVARMSDHSWFFDVSNHDERDSAPLKIGGWPRWIQCSTWPADSEFVFQLNSSERGKLGFCGGSIYGFLRGGEWILRTDMF